MKKKKLKTISLLILAYLIVIYGIILLVSAIRMMPTWSHYLIQGFAFVAIGIEICSINGNKYEK